MPRIPALVDALYASIPTGVGARSTVLAVGARSRRRSMEQGRRGPSAVATARARRPRSGSNRADVSPEPGATRSPARARERGLASARIAGLRQSLPRAAGRRRDPRRRGVRGRVRLRLGALAIMIHTGSRGLGHQVCTDYLAVTGAALRRYGIAVPDRQLACAPVGSSEAIELPRGHASAPPTFAFANRQVLAHVAGQASRARSSASARASLGLACVYDVAHNIAKEEEQRDRRRRPPASARAPQGRDARPFQDSRCSCRATWALLVRPAWDGDGHARDLRLDLPRRGAPDEPDGRGQGRPRSRTSTRSSRPAAWWRAPPGHESLAEEMPEAYKDVREVVDVVHRFGISTRVARLAAARRDQAEPPAQAAMRLAQRMVD